MNDANNDNPNGPVEHKDPSNTMKNDPQTNSALSGKLGVFIFVVLFGTAGYLTWHTLTTAQTPTPDPPPVTYMCSETMKTFSHKLTMEEMMPVLSPHTNRRTGYVAEECFWTKDGKRKTDPTFVILNKYIGKAGPTICPDCGHVVYPHNPLPPMDTPADQDSIDTKPDDATTPSTTTQPTQN